MVDPSKGWEHLWRQREVIQRGWAQPSPEVVALAKQLRDSGARRALDVGCGPGRHTVALAQLGYSMAGTDVSPTALVHCRTWLASLGLRAALAEADMRALPFAGETFDLVVSYNVVYHAKRAGVEAALAEIARVLRAGGHLFVTFIATDDAKYLAYREKVARDEGIEVEPNTYRLPNDPDDDGDLPHHFVDAAEARELLSAFDLLSLEPERLRRSDEAGRGEIVKVHWHAHCVRLKG